MKTKIHSLVPVILFVACAALGYAAEPVVEIKSASDVRVDGKSFGAVADTIANNPKLASAVQRALVVWEAGLASQAKADADAAKASADTALATKDAQVKAAANVQAMADSFVARTKAAIAAGDLVTAGKIVAEAETPAKEKEKATLDKQIADLNAKRAALDEVSTKVDTAILSK